MLQDPKEQEAFGRNKESRREIRVETSREVSSF